MTFRFVCYTLFNIQATGVKNRHYAQLDNEQTEKRNTQSNFDTILQCIGMLTQPENVSNPVQVKSIPEFGTEYSANTCWKFEFETDRPLVFENGVIPLGALYDACSGVPMAKCQDQIVNGFLDSSSEYRNIVFLEQ